VRLGTYGAMKRLPGNLPKGAPDDPRWLESIGVACNRQGAFWSSVTFKVYVLLFILLLLDIISCSSFLWHSISFSSYNSSESLITTYTEFLVYLSLRSVPWYLYIEFAN